MPEMYLQPLRAGRAADDTPDSGILITHFPFLVGRGLTCDYVLAHPMVSRQHCEIFLDGEEIWVRDLKSRNGTSLNALALTSPQPMQDGDILKIGFLFFQMRLGAPALSRPAAKGENAPAGDHPRQVLVVEDNADTAETLAILLHDWGFEVQVAHDGPQAIRAAREHPPDAVLLDIHLPGMNGYEVAEHLRGPEGLGKARLVALTGYEASMDWRRSREAGFDVLLTKPVDPETLGKALCSPC